MTAPASAVRLLDIELPPPPPEPHWGGWLALAGLLLLLGFGLWRILRSPRARARRRLARLPDSAPDVQALAFQLAAILREGLGVSRLAADRPPPRRPALAARWAVFVKRLDQARYRPPPGPAESRQALVRECRFWLAKWR